MANKESRGGRVKKEGWQVNRVEREGVANKEWGGRVERDGVASKE